jgi:rhodanese-related sulfurtransferase
MEEGAQVVDVLGRREYEWAHLPGAQLIWLPTLDERAPERLDREKPVVVYCNDYL